MIRFGMTFGKQIDKPLIDSYFLVLERFSDKQIKFAAKLCLEEITVFPKPAHIVKRIGSSDTAIHDAFLKKLFTCGTCKNYVSLIIEFQCLECRSGVPASAGRTPLSFNFEQEFKNYSIQDATLCNSCGSIAQCIKEPTDTGNFECRGCYTGLTMSQYKGKLNDLANVGHRFDDLDEPTEGVPF